MGLVFFYLSAVIERRYNVRFAVVVSCKLLQLYDQLCSVYSSAPVFGRVGVGVVFNGSWVVFKGRGAGSGGGGGGTI